MSQYQNPYGGAPITQTDEYGNPVHHAGSTDQYGNPIQGATGGYGATTGAHGGPPLTGHHEGHTVGGILHRSGSSSSSSSEDDGQGGRRKKGIKEKIKEKMPGTGTHKEEQYHTTAPGAGYGASAGTGAGYGAGAGAGYGAEQPHEKKGMMEKIKEKMPGHH